jgi:hypothetical protein
MEGMSTQEIFIPSADLQAAHNEYVRLRNQAKAAGKILRPLGRPRKWAPRVPYVAPAPLQVAAVTSSPSKGWVTGPNAAAKLSTK